MAIDMKKMRSKLNALQGKGGGSKNVFWKPKDGEQTIRIVPTSDGDPFKEYWFYYNLTNTPVLCPKRNFQEDSPVLDFATQLYREGTPESTKMAKDLFPKQRFFAPVIVRGQESEGVKVWGFSKTVYQELLQLVLTPDYGDITDIDTGTDLVLTYGKAPGAMFPSTKITPKRNASPLCPDGDDDCKALLDEVPDFDSLFERKTTEEVQVLLDKYISGDSGGDEKEKYSSPVKTSSTVSAVDKAFDDLLGEELPS